MVEADSPVGSDSAMTCVKNTRSSADRPCPYDVIVSDVAQVATPRSDVAPRGKKPYSVPADTAECNEMAAGVVAAGMGMVSAPELSRMPEAAAAQVMAWRA